MKSNKITLLILISILVAGCDGGGTPTLVSIAVTPANPSIPGGVARQFTATGTYSDGTSHDITTQVTCMVMSCLLPLEYVPEALNCMVLPTGMLGLAGATVMEDRFTAITVRVVFAEILP